MPIKYNEKKCPGCLGALPIENKFCCYKCYLKIEEPEEYKSRFGEKVF